MTADQDDPLSRYEGLVEDYGAFRAACERPLPMVVRVNTIKADIDRAIAALEDDGVGVDQRDWDPTLLELDTDSPGTTWPYFVGWLHGQEEVSALPMRALDPSRGERVFDVCAAPGSKTSQIAAVMADDGLIVANDASLGRLASLRFNTERLGVTAVAVTNQDGRNYSMKPFGFETFDRVLVDAPCSCEGTVRKNPNVLEEWSESALADLGDLQAGILRRAVQVTRPGGTVVYGTCTFAPEENEAVLDAVLDTEECRVVPFDCPLDAEPGVEEWRGTAYDSQVRNARRLYPHLNDTGGFFCARLAVGG